ncbi:MAG TPA: hypothetical protein DCG47_15425 [Spirochaetaceae bacterium]|nr:hypothetical protein [Spirochaetaceae bacterium]
MSRLNGAMLALAAPPLALALAFPAGLDTALSPAWAAALPLVWAALVVCMAGAPSPALALGLSLPFSSWSLLHCSSWSLAPRPPALEALELLALAALFMSSLTLARLKRRGARLILAYALFIPGIALQASTGPLASLACAAFIAALAALTKGRRRAEA